LIINKIYEILSDFQIPFIINEQTEIKDLIIVNLVIKNEQKKIVIDKNSNRVWTPSIISYSFENEVEDYTISYDLFISLHDFKIVTDIFIKRKDLFFSINQIPVSTIKDLQRVSYDMIEVIKSLYVVSIPDLLKIMKKYSSYIIETADFSIKNNVIYLKKTQWNIIGMYEKDNTINISIEANNLNLVVDIRIDKQELMTEFTISKKKNKLLYLIHKKEINLYGYFYFYQTLFHFLKNLSKEDLQKFNSNVIINNEITYIKFSSKFLTLLFPKIIYTHSTPMLLIPKKQIINLLIRNHFPIPYGTFLLSYETTKNFAKSLINKYINESQTYNIIRI